ncbi:hypothetical protein DFH06DRAFT_1433249, partial [Mycena polygramma]
HCFETPRRPRSFLPGSSTKVDALEDTEGVPRTVASEENSLPARLPSLLGVGLNKPHSLPNSSARERIERESAGGGPHIRTLWPSSTTFHFASGLHCSLRTPGCISDSGGSYWVGVESRVEYEPEREDDWVDREEANEVTGDGGSKRLGDERTTGETIRRDDLGTTDGTGFGREALLAVVAMRGASTGKWAGRSGSPAVFLMLRVMAGMDGCAAGRGTLFRSGACCGSSNTFTSLTRSGLFAQVRNLCRGHSE